MRLSILPFALTFLTAVIAAPSAETSNVSNAVDNYDDAPTAVDFTDAEPTMKLEARADHPVVTATVTADALKYRTCPRTSCTAVGQYSRGTKVKVKCYTRKNTTTVDGDAGWALLTNGYYVSMHYLSWPGQIWPC